MTLLQTKFPLEAASPLEAGRGQVLIFSYLLVHGSYANLSERARRMLLIQVGRAAYDVHSERCRTVWRERATYTGVHSGSLLTLFSVSFIILYSL